MYFRRQTSHKYLSNCWHKTLNKKNKTKTKTKTKNQTKPQPKRYKDADKHQIQKNEI